MQPWVFPITAWFISSPKKINKSSKPVVKSKEAKLKLQDCIECSNWSVFEAAAKDLDELADTVSLYFSLCEDVCAHQVFWNSQ